MAPGNYKVCQLSQYYSKLVFPATMMHKLTEKINIPVIIQATCLDYDLF